MPRMLQLTVFQYLPFFLCCSATTPFRALGIWVLPKSQCAKLCKLAGMSRIGSNKAKFHNNFVLLMARNVHVAASFLMKAMEL